MTPAPDNVPDPRRFAVPSDAPPSAARLHTLAAQSLAAETGQVADSVDASLASELAAMLASQDGEALACVLETAPSVAVHRHIGRVLARVTQSVRGDDEGLAVTLFAIPLVIVAAISDRGRDVQRISGVVADVGALCAVLREHRAFGGNESFALGNALVSANAIDVRRLPPLLAARTLAQHRVPLALPAAPIDVIAEERAYLRFLIGSAVAAPGVDVLAASPRVTWTMPLARALNAQLSPAGVAMVALPRPASPLTAAVSQGLAAQRDVSAQLFASAALRSLRAEAGEPTAVISAHEAPDAPGGGELRLSLSSPLAPRSAQGFRCPIHAGERVVDVVTMLVDLLRDCRVADVRLLPGVHADRDPLTGGPLLFKAETLPPRAVH